VKGYDKSSRLVRAMSVLARTKSMKRNEKEEEEEEETSTKKWNPVTYALHSK